jgi:GNAT superfamily N-acetyltransferase
VTAVALTAPGPTAAVGHDLPVDERTLARLAHLNYLTFGRDSALWSDAGAVEEGGGVLSHASGTEFPFVFNGAYRTDPAVAPADVLARADAFFGDRGYTLVTHPHRDEDLHAHAEAEGLWAFGTSPEMVCRQRLADAERTDGIVLRRATDEEGIADFVAVGSAAYPSLGMPDTAMGEAIDRLDRVLEPHIAVVVAYDGDQPVAAAQALLSHGIAGVYWVGTLEAARGNGLGEAVCRWVTNWAFDQGAAAQTLQASTMGEPIYNRMGYETIYRYTSWYRSGER